MPCSTALWINPRQAWRLWRPEREQVCETDTKAYYIQEHSHYSVTETVNKIHCHKNSTLINRFNWVLSV